MLSQRTTQFCSQEVVYTNRINYIELLVLKRHTTSTSCHIGFRFPLRGYPVRDKQYFRSYLIVFHFYACMPMVHIYPTRQLYIVTFRKKPFVFVVFYAFHSLFSCLTLWQKSISFQWWKIYVIIMKYVEVMTLNVRLPHFAYIFPHFHKISPNSATAMSFTLKLEMYEWPKSLVLTVLTRFGSC